jgi:hypothetical protein
VFLAGILYESLFLCAAIALFLIMLSIVYTSWKNGISPMPASAPVRRAVAGEINRLGRYGTLVEAGSGWGTLILSLVRHCPGWQLIGIENSPVPLWTSRLLAAAAARLMPGNYRLSNGRMTLLRGDIYTFSYEQADIVVCYLYPGAMERLSVLLRGRLSPGARLISICFALPGWQAERVVACEDWLHTKVYIYRAEGANEMLE